MNDVTDLFFVYRECVRHLWNTYFRPLAEPTVNWDLRDEFDAIARGIFSSLVLRPLAVFDRELAAEYSANPAALPGFRLTDLPPPCLQRRSGWFSRVGKPAVGDARVARLPGATA